MNSDQDTKDEINLLFEHRPHDRVTRWPLAKDADFGHPYDECQCGHMRHRHGFDGSIGALRPGHGNCIDMCSVDILAPDDPNPSFLRSCRCSQFVLKKRANE